MMDDVLRPGFLVLGPVQVRRAGRPVRLSGKLRAVLSTLLLHLDAPISKEQLVAALWDTPPASAVANLQTYVSQLRRALTGLASLQTQGSGYLLLLDRDDLDLTVFEEAVRRGRRQAARGDLVAADHDFRRAFALRRGRPVEDTWLGSAMIPRIHEIEERLAQAQADWIDVRLALGRHDQVIGELQGMVDAHPLGERAWAQLMLALYRAGRRADALDVYHRVRAALTAEVGIEPGPDLVRLHTRILQDDPSLDLPAVREVATWTALCQLPPNIGDFVGRDRELESLSVVMLGEQSAAPVITTVHGPPGVGKSTLAVHLAHRLRPRFPDGQLFVRLAGASAVPRCPGDVLAELLRALRVDGSAIPESWEERAALYRSRLADRAVLLLFDDAADEEQVRPLLPGTPRSAVLVTSRRRLMLDGVTALSLGTPTPAEARDLLARLAGEERLRSDPEAAQAILQACGQLPLAIRIAGSRLAARPGWPLRDLADRLEDTGKLLDELALGQVSVRTNFAVSYAALPPAVRRAFRLLGLAGFESAAEWTVAALLDEPGRDADGAIETLVLAGLLTPSETDVAGQPRYRMHDLLRVYARDRAEAEEDEPQRREAVRGLITACLERVRAAVRDLPHPFAPAPPGALVPREEPVAGREWAAAERENLVAAVSLAVGAGYPDAAVELAYHLTSYLVAHNFYDDVTRVQNAVMTIGDPGLTMRARLVLADADIDHARYREAFLEFETLLRFFEEAGDRHAATYAMTGRGVCKHVFGDHQAAVDDLRRAVSLFHDLGDAGGALYALVALSASHLEVGRHDDAIAVCRAGLELTDDGWNDVDRSRLLRGLGIAHYEKGLVDAAIGYYEESLRLTRDLDCDGGERQTLRRLGEAYGAIGRFDEAVRVLDQGLEKFVSAGDRLGEALTAYALGEIYHRQGRVRDALRHYTRSGELIGEHGAPIWRARALRGIGRAYAELGDRTAATAVWTEALGIFTELHAAEAEQVRELIDGATGAPG